MIKSIAEFLEELSNREAKKLAESNIKHTVTIGSMYEGLTKHVLEQALPESFGLRIVDGFVHDGFGNDSGQIDCMLVMGEGEEIPYIPGSFRWHVKDVIAVFEVKKSLYGGDLSDAFDHLNTVTARYSNYVQTTSEMSSINIDASLKNYAQVTGKIAPHPDDWKSMPQNLHMILHSIMMDQLMPARIIFGYGGYKTEESLRKGFLDFIGGKIMTQGYGVPNIPNLIIANGNSIVKVNGHPWCSPLYENGLWPILGSRSSSAIELMLEIIWTKLSYIKSIPELFGEDLELEVFNSLLLAKPQVDPNEGLIWGWVYHSIEPSHAELEHSNKSADWCPVFLTSTQNTIMFQICQGENIKISDIGFIDYLKGAGESVDEFVTALIDTNLVALDGDLLQLVTYECAMAILPDGRFVAGENNTGRLSRWIESFVKNFRTQI